MELFGDMFDFDHDGEMNIIEKAVEYAFLDEMMNDDEEEQKQTELELSGLDSKELEFMDSDERREALEEAGLDPDDYDF